MRRVPIVPTIIVLALFTALVSLGVWQLERRQWKAQLVRQLEAAPRLPPLEPGDFLEAMQGTQSINYRRAELPCSPGTVLPYDLRGGSSAKGDSGFLVLVSCRPNRKPPDIVAVAGWTPRPDTIGVPISVDTIFKGLIIERPYGDAEGRPRFMLIPDTAVPPLQVSQMPDPGGLPDNHLSYAGQWFGLALALLGIYGVWLRRRWVADPARAP